MRDPLSTSNYQLATARDVERALLKRADAYAKRPGISRARLFAQGIESILGSAG